MITKNRLLLILGIWIALIPFLGFPSSYKSFFVLVSGLAVAAVAFLLAREKRNVQILQNPAFMEKNETASDVFAENAPNVRATPAPPAPSFSSDEQNVLLEREEPSDKQSKSDENL